MWRRSCDLVNYIYFCHIQVINNQKHHNFQNHFILLFNPLTAVKTDFPVKNGGQNYSFDADPKLEGLIWKTRKTHQN